MAGPTLPTPSVGNRLGAAATPPSEVGTKPTTPVA